MFKHQLSHGNIELSFVQSVPLVHLDLSPHIFVRAGFSHTLCPLWHTVNSPQLSMSLLICKTWTGPTLCSSGKVLLLRFKVLPAEFTFSVYLAQIYLSFMAIITAWRIPELNIFKILLEIAHTRGQHPYVVGRWSWPQHLDDNKRTITALKASTIAKRIRTRNKIFKNLKKVEVVAVICRKPSRVFRYLVVSQTSDGAQQRRWRFWGLC